MDKIIWCDHSNETSLAKPLLGATFFSVFYNIKFGYLMEFWPWTLLAVKRLVMEPERGRNYKKFYLRLQSSLKLSLCSHKRGRGLARKQSSWLQTTCSQYNLVKTDAFGRMYRYLKANLHSINAEKHRFFCLTPCQSSCIAGNQNECYRKLLHDVLTLWEFLSRKLILVCYRNYNSWYQLQSTVWKNWY